jgi:hypothetical protein
MRWLGNLAALVVVLLGIALSPLRATAAEIPPLVVYDAAVGLTPTTNQASHDAVRPKGEGPRINAYDCDAARLFGYDDAPNLRVIAGAGVPAYDGALEHADRRDVRGTGAIYGAAAATTAAEAVSARVEVTALLASFEVPGCTPDAGASLNGCVSYGR